MTFTLEANTDEVIDLPECIRLLDKLPRLRQREGLDEAARCLRMLANHRTFLVDLVNHELRAASSLDAYQTSNNFPQQVIDLGGGRLFRLRANLWPAADAEVPADWEKNLFAYQMPHDHDADFLTIGYWGPGYETSIYEYDMDRIIGHDGEQVDLRFLEKTRLTEGKVMFYRANQDIHTQLPPEALSISINLLIAQPDGGVSTNQYWFDVEQRTIVSSIARISFTPFVFLCRLAGMVGNGATVDLLDSLSRRHPNPRVRAEVVRTLASLDPANGSRYWRAAADDTHPYVQRIARGQLGPRSSPSIDRSATGQDAEIIP